MKPTVDEAIARVARAAEWILMDTVPLDFVCHRPQGMDRAYGSFFVSSSEILRPGPPRGRRGRRTPRARAVGTSSR